MVKRIRYRPPGKIQKIGYKYKIFIFILADRKRERGPETGPSFFEGFKVEIFPLHLTQTARFGIRCKTFEVFHAGSLAGDQDRR